MFRSFNLFTSFFLISVVFSYPSFAQNSTLNELSSKSPTSKRILAQKKIIDLGKNSVPLLKQGIKHSDKSVRMEVIRLIGELRVRQVLAELLNILKTTNDTRTIVIVSYAIGQIQDYRATPTLRYMASSQENNIVKRRSAIIALGLLGDSKAIPTLEEILNEESELLRIFAAGSLGLLGSDFGLKVALSSSDSLDHSERMHAIQALGLIGSDKSYDKLSMLLQKNPDMIQRQSVELSKFQIKLHSLALKERVEAIKNKLLSAKESSALTRWGIDELGKIEKEDAESALAVISESHHHSIIRSRAQSKRKIIDMREEIARSAQ